MSTHVLHVIWLARLVRITVEKILLAFDIRLLKAGKDPGFKCVNSTTEEQIKGIIYLRISSMNPTTVEESR